MARIKELRELIAKGGDGVEDLKKELAELEAEAKAESGESTDEKAKVESEEKEIEDAIDKMADTLVERVATKMDEKAKASAETKGGSDTSHKVDVKSSRMIFDKGLGNVSVEKLREVKHEIHERKIAGKKSFEVSGETIHFLHALQMGDKEKLQVLSEGTGTQGGYLVPEDFADMIVEDLRDATVMRQIASSMTTNVDTVHLPTLDTRPQAQWRAEKAVKATSTAQFNELVLTPYSLASIVPLTQELVDDATLGVNGSVVNYVVKLMVQALAEKEDRAFWTGSGAGQPTGVTTYGVSSIAKTGTSNLADQVIQLYYSLNQGYRSRAVWVGNSASNATLRQLKDNQNRYLVQDLGQSPFGTILGRPIYEQNDLGNELYFGDFSYYMIADRQGIRVDTSNEATVGGQNAFERNLVFVRVEKRVDGELTLTRAVKKITGM